MRKFVFFDTETTGLPKQWGAKFTDINNWPRIIQLAFIVADENGDELFRYKELIKPEGWTMPTDKFWVDNGFTHEENVEKGVEIYSALRMFQGALKKCDYKIAHNVNFDKPIVMAEMIRAGITYQLMQYKKSICTMRSTTNLVGIKKSHASGNKWPKLIELHQHLFGCEFDDAHDALADVVATKNCFFELLKRGYYKLN